MFKKLYIMRYLTNHKPFYLYMLASSYFIEQGAGFEQEIDRILFNRLNLFTILCMRIHLY